jgi:predicted enzyme related to lactoylglutathione lyase
MANKIVHWAMMGADGAALSGFYAGLFDWNLQGVEGFDGYNLIDAEQTGVGGAVGQGSEQMPNYLTIYIEVESIDDHLERIGAAGGSTIVPRTVLPGMVTFALFSDPAGNIVGLVESDVSAEQQRSCYSSSQ